MSSPTSAAAYPHASPTANTPILASWKKTRWNENKMKCFSKNGNPFSSDIFIIFINMDESLLPARPQGTVITRFNYNRPKWFGGFFGDPDKHNKNGNCCYDSEAMNSIITPENLNRLVEPLYTMTPVLSYHMAITIFLAFSVLLTVLQQGFNALIEFAFITSIDNNNWYLHTLGVIWYCVWGVGLFTIIPLYYVSLHHIERYFR